MKLKSYFLTRKNINEVHQSPYNDTAALKTVSQIINKNDLVFPKIFSLMGVMGRILAPLFFLAVLFAGISSAFAFFEPVIID